MRTTYVQVRNEDGTYELIEKSQVHQRELPRDAGVLWGDLHYANITGLKGEDLSTRTKHREYMRQNGLSMADDWTNEWETARKKREDFLTTGGDHRARREQIERAIYEINNRK
jgi:hypothetical protein